MFDSVIFYIVAFLIGSLLIGLYVSVVNIVIMSMKPQKKYQKTSSFDPAFPAWVGTIFVMVCTSMIIGIQTLPNTNIPYRRYIIMMLTVLIFGALGMISNASRHDIHPDDPEKKLTPGTTITNIIAASIPILVSVVAASGIASAIGSPGTVLTAAILFFVLAIPSAMGAALTMLFARSASNPSYTYGTIASIAVMTLGLTYITSPNP
jgi:hypothetical protein